MVKNQWQKKYPEKISKNILGLIIEMQYAGKPYTIEEGTKYVKIRYHKGSLSIKSGKTYIQ